MKGTSPARNGIEVPRLKCVVFNLIREGKSWTRLLPWESIWQRVERRASARPLQGLVGRQRTSKHSVSPISMQGAAREYQRFATWRCRERTYALARLPES